MIRLRKPRFSKRDRGFILKGVGYEGGKIKTVKKQIVHNFHASLRPTWVMIIIGKIILMRR